MVFNLPSAEARERVQVWRKLQKFSCFALRKTPDTGGPIDGPAIVGEQGPELFVPSSHGSIIPNHKLSSVGGGSGMQIVNHIDATGSTDPAQTEAAIHRAIAQASPHIMAGAVQLNRSMQQRRPSSAR